MRQTIDGDEDVLNPAGALERGENLTEGRLDGVGCDARKDERDGGFLGEVRKDFVLEHVSRRGVKARQSDDGAVLRKVAHGGGCRGSEDRV
jgi:hypothetical protein